MRPITVTVGNLAVAGNATQIRTASVVAAGPVVLNGTLTAGVDRNVLVTFASAEPGLRLELTGRNVAGQTVSEVLYGPAAPGTVLSVNQYNTVLSMTASRASTGAISVGTSSTGTSSWVALDDFAPSYTSIQCTVAGAANYTIQSTLDDPTSVNNPALAGNPALATWINSNDPAAVGATASLQSNFMFAPKFARVLLNSGTGLVTATFLQSGSS